jgi:hypothetical protein
MPDIEISMLDHCTGRQLKELLALASTDAKTTWNWLLEVGDLEQLEYLLTDMCSRIGQSAGALLRAVCSPATPVDALVAIKSTAKRLAVAAEAAPQKAAATLLYHLAVASALGHHARYISSKDPAERLGLYKDLAAELSDDDLAAIFEKAVAGFSESPPWEVDL